MIVLLWWRNMLAETAPINGSMVVSITERSKVPVVVCCRRAASTSNPMIDSYTTLGDENEAAADWCVRLVGFDDESRNAKCMIYYYYYYYQNYTALPVRICGVLTVNVAPSSVSSLGMGPRQEPAPGPIWHLYAVWARAADSLAGQNLYNLCYDETLTEPLVLGR